MEARRDAHELRAVAPMVAVVPALLTALGHRHPRHLTAGQVQRLERDVHDHEPRPRGAVEPSGATAGIRGRGPEEVAEDRHVHVTGVRVDRHRTRTRRTPVREVAGDHRRVEQTRRVEDRRDGTRAVVRTAEARVVTAAPRVRVVVGVDRVRRRDHPGDHPLRRAGRDRRTAPGVSGAAGVPRPGAGVLRRTVVRRRVPRPAGAVRPAMRHVRGLGPDGSDEPCAAPAAGSADPLDATVVCGENVVSWATCDFGA